MIKKISKEAFLEGVKVEKVINKKLVSRELEESSRETLNCSLADKPQEIKKSKRVPVDKKDFERIMSL